MNALAHKTVPQHDVPPRQRHLGVPPVFSHKEAHTHHGRHDMRAVCAVHLNAVEVLQDIHLQAAVYDAFVTAYLTRTYSPVSEAFVTRQSPRRKILAGG